MASDRVNLSDGTLSADLIAQQSFRTARRGFDPDEVRVFLGKVGAELLSMHERQAILEEALHDAEYRAAHPTLDEQTLLSLVGDETAHILRSAHEAAADIKSRAEENTSRILKEAHAQADLLRGEAETVLAKRTEEAEAVASRIREAARVEAERLGDQARQQAKAIRTQVEADRQATIEGAQATRDGILRELSRKRNLAVVQVEQLRAGRERLMESYQLVRRTLDEVTAELARAESEARAAADAVRHRSLAIDEPDGLDDLIEPPGAAVSGIAKRLRAPSPVAAGAVSPTGPSALIGAGPAPPAAVTAEPAGAGVAGPAQPASGSDEMVGSEVARARKVAPGPPSAGAGVAAGGSEARFPQPTVVTGVAVASGGSPSAGSGAGSPGARVGGSGAVPPDPAAVATGADAGPTGGGGGRGGVVSVSAPPVPAGGAGDPASGSVGAGAGVVGGAGQRGNGSSGVGARAAGPGPQLKTGPAAGAQGARSGQAAPDPSRAGPAGSAPPAGFGRAAPSTGLAAPDPGAVPDATALSGDEGRTPSVDSLFARIRADRAEAVAHAREVLAQPETTDDPPVPDADEALLQRRDGMVGTIEAALTKRLKRALQDDQNDLLDRLRGLRPPHKAALVLPDRGDHAARFAAAGRPFLGEAVAAGATFVASLLPGVKGGHATHEPDALVETLANAIVDPLRRRLEAVLTAGEGDDTVALAESVGGSYREWKTQRIEALASDHIAAAFAQGAFAATPLATPQRWLVEDTDGPCPDCDDNVLAGALPKGEPFPTGQRHPPAHAGCRCLLVPQHT